MTDKTSQMLRAEAEELLRLAAEVRQREIAQVVQTIKSQIKEYDLKPDELFPGIGKAIAKSGAPEPRPPKYRGPDGQLWGGGSGRKPNWVREIEAQGRSIKEFAI